MKKDKRNHLTIIIVAVVMALFLLLAFGCTKEEPTKTECSCYEEHEYKDYNAQQAQVIWMYDYSTTPQADLCSKDNGQWIYTGSASQFRHKTICN